MGECGTSQKPLRRQQLAYANTETISQGYDKAGELTRISSPSLNFTYHFDQAGRRTTIDRSGAAVGYGNVFYKYECTIRSTGGWRSSGRCRPNSTGDGYHQSYTYDGDGSLTRTEKDGKEVTLYYYDEASPLLQVTDPLGQITRYSYNGDGKRVSMTDAKGKTIFIYDGNEVLAEADATGTIKIAYSRMPNGQLVSQRQGGERSGTTCMQ